MEEKLNVCKSDRHGKAVVVYTTIDCPLCLAISNLPEGTVQECSTEIHNLINTKTGEKFSVRAMNILNRMGVKTLLDLQGLDYHKILKVKNCGKTTADEIMEMVSTHTGKIIP